MLYDECVLEWTANICLFIFLFNFIFILFLFIIICNVWLVYLWCLIISPCIHICMWCGMFCQHEAWSMCHNHMNSIPILSWWNDIIPFIVRVSVMRCIQELQKILILLMRSWDVLWGASQIHMILLFNSTLLSSGK